MTPSTGIWMFTSMFPYLYTSRTVEHVVLCIKEPELVAAIRTVTRVRTVTHVVTVIFMSRAVTVVLSMCCAKGSNSSYVSA